MMRLSKKPRRAALTGNRILLLSNLQKKAILNSVTTGIGTLQYAAVRCFPVAGRLPFARLAKPSGAAPRRGRPNHPVDPALSIIILEKWLKTKTAGA